MSKIYPVGIDVSAKELVVAMHGRNGAVRVSRFANDATGHQALCRGFGKRSGMAQVCLEATGSYSLDIAWSIDGAGGAPVCSPSASTST